MMRLSLIYYPLTGQLCHLKVSVCGVNATRERMKVRCPSGNSTGLITFRNTRELFGPNAACCFVEQPAGSVPFNSGNFVQYENAAFLLASY